MISLGLPPLDFKETHHKLAPLQSLTIEPVGKEFMARARRVLLSRTLTQDLELEMALLEAGTDDLSLQEDEPESIHLLKSDPSQWKVCFSIFGN